MMSDRSAALAAACAAAAVCLSSGCGLFGAIEPPQSQVDGGQVDGGVDSDAQVADAQVADPDASAADAAADAGPIECDVPAELVARSDERARGGETYHATPELARCAVTRWSKTYGPDTLSVDGRTGAVIWYVADEIPTESFHVGIEGQDACGGVVRDTWVVTLGDRAILRVGFDQTYKTLRSAFAAASFGDTIIVDNGTYQGEENNLSANGTPAGQPPSGTEDAFTTVIAQDPGEVTLQSSLFWVGKWGGLSHVAVKGILFDGSVGLNTSFDDAPRPHHFKFVDLGTRSGFWISNSDDVLVEGCYAFGDGRYKLSAFRSERVIFRRCVMRLDHAPLEGQEAPFGGASAYSSDDVVFQNVLDIDSDQADAYPLGEITGAFSVPTTSGASRRIVYERGVVLNNATKFGSYDDNNGLAEVEYRNIVAWDFDVVAGLPDLTHGFGQGTFDHMTFGQIRTEGDVAGIVQGIFNGWGGNRDEFKNSFFSHIQLPLFYQVEALSYNAFHDVAEYAFDGAEHRPDTFVQVESREQVLTHLPRVNAGSPLDGAADDGGAIGATVMTFVGRSGTFHGEDGWNEETDIPMWPFPHEDVIARHMRAYTFDGVLQDGRGVSVTGDRGFAASGAAALDGGAQTLTTYIWEYLGAPCPAEICRGRRER